MALELSIRDFARRLWRLADLVQAAERRRSFRAKAYRTAVWSLDDLPSLDADEETLLATPGIGPGVTRLIAEYRTSGELAQSIPLETAYPSETARLRRLPRMNPTMLRGLKDLGVETTVDLAGAIESGAAATLKGAGPQTLELWSRILDLYPDSDHVPAHQAWVTASALADHIARHSGGWVDIAGEVRRLEEWVTRIDLVVLTENRADLERFLDQTASLSAAEIGNDEIRGRTHSGMDVSIHPSPPEGGGTALIRATGPAGHTAVSTEEQFPTEAEAYEDAGLPLIPPPARHLPLELAQSVVVDGDLRGDLHIHTEASPDGRMTLEEVATRVGSHGYGYLAITDHTQGLRFGGLDEAAVAAQAAELARVRELFDSLTILHGAELNIGPDGSLDLAEEALSLLDMAVAGVHSYFGLDRQTQTQRVVTALEHPTVRVLAHPSGRRIGIRPPLDLDMEAVIDAAVVNGVALEVNGHRDRLDLSAEWIARAASRGAVFAANSDAHRIGELSNITNAVGVLQRAGIEPAQVVNTWSEERFSAWLAGTPLEAPLAE